MAKTPDCMYIYVYSRMRELAKPPAKNKEYFMVKIVAIANQKGGVGKTAVSLNFGIPLADRGVKTLFMDFDPQRNLTGILAPELHKDPDMETGRHSASVIGMFESVIKPEPYKLNDNAFIMGGCKKLENINQENIFNMADSLDLIKDEFDLIIIDCPPSAISIQHAALAVSHGLLIVTMLDSQSYNGVEELIITSRQVKRRLNPKLEILGVLVNLKESIGVRIEAKYKDKIISEFGNILFDAELGKTVKVKEAVDVGKPLIYANKRFAEKYNFINGMEEFYKKAMALEGDL